MSEEGSIEQPMEEHTEGKIDAGYCTSGGNGTMIQPDTQRRLQETPSCVEMLSRDIHVRNLEYQRICVKSSPRS